MIENKIEPQTQVEQTPTPEVTQPAVENQEEINWKKFRDAREQERKQKEAAEKYAREKELEANALKKALEASLDKPSYQRQEQQQEELTEDQRIERKVSEAIRIREVEYEKQRIQKDQEELPRKLESNLPDFNKVCTTENLDYLEYHYPEIAIAYKHMPDSYDKWAGLYKALKRFLPNTNNTKEQKQMEKNLAKPQAMSKPGMTQTGDQAPMYMDDSRRAANWARMQRIIKGA